jgi:hypothetical protein
MILAKNIFFSALALSAIVVSSCKKSDTTATGATSADGTTTNNFSRLYAKMYNLVSFDSSSTTTVKIKITDVPDHKSPFFGVGNAKYEAYNGDNPSFSTYINLNGMIGNPTLLSQNLTYTIPRNPVKTSSNTSTTGGPIGVSRNGVAFFNQYNGVGALLDDLEINNADQYLGHPTPTMAGAQYHYHYEPKFLTATFGNSSFMGFLLDGFPVYGPYENNVKITTSMLDSYNGHVSATEDYPNDKIYHYHVISASSSVSASLKLAAPWINGGKYYGTKGTVN